MIKNLIGDLPNDLRQKMRDHQIPEHVSEKIVSNPLHAWYLMGAESLEKEIALWVTEEVSVNINNHNLSYDIYRKNVPITHLADLLAFVKAGKISSSAAKEIFSEMVKTGMRAGDIMQRLGLEQVSDSDELDSIIEKIIANNPSEALRLKDGDNKLIGFFMGQIMRESKGRANPKLVSEILIKKIQSA